MPAHDGILIRVGLLFTAVVNEPHPRVALHLPYLWLEQLPQLGRALLLACPQPRDLIVAPLSSPPLRQPWRGCRPKRADQIVGIQVKQFFLHLAPSLAFVGHPRKVSYSIPCAPSTGQRS